MRYATFISGNIKANGVDIERPLIQHNSSKLLPVSIAIVLLFIATLNHKATAQYSVLTPLKGKYDKEKKTKSIEKLKADIDIESSDSLEILKFIKSLPEINDDADNSFIIKSYEIEDSTDYKFLMKIFGDQFKKEVNPDGARLYAKSLYNKIDSIGLLIKKYKNLPNNPKTDAKNNNILLLLKSVESKLKVYAGLFSSINTIIGEPELGRSFLPLKTNAQTDFFYDNVRNKNFKLLNTVVIQGKDDNSVVASEIVTGYFSVFRLKLSTVIYNTNAEDSAKTVVDKINNGGGLVNLDVNYPLFFRNCHEWAFILDSNLKWASDINAFGNEIAKDDYVGYLEPSLSAYFEMRLRKTDARIFLNYNFGRVFGSKALDETIGNESGDAFYVSTLYAGINFSNKVRLSANIPLRSIQGIGGTENFTVGIQYTPQDKD